MRRQAVVLVAVLAGVLAFFTLAWPFSLGLHNDSPNVRSSVLCASPLVQLFDPPRPGLPQMTEVPAGFFEEIRPNVQPRCREVGRSRAAAGLAMLTTGVALLLLVRASSGQRQSAGARLDVPSAVGTLTAPLQTNR